MAVRTKWAPSQKQLSAIGKVVAEGHPEDFVLAVLGLTATCEPSAAYAEKGFKRGVIATGDLYAHADAFGMSHYDKNDPDGTRGADGNDLDGMLSEMVAVNLIAKAGFPGRRGQLYRYNEDMKPVERAASTQAIGSVFKSLGIDDPLDDSDEEEPAVAKRQTKAKGKRQTKAKAKGKRKLMYVDEETGETSEVNDNGVE